MFLSPSCAQSLCDFRLHGVSHDAASPMPVLAIVSFSSFLLSTQLAYHNVGTCLWHVSLQTAMYQRISNKPKEPSLWFAKIVNEVKILWRLVAVGNGWLWLTPCKRMKLRRSEWAQLGVSTKEGVSLVEGRLWSKQLMLPRPTVSDARHYIWACLQAALASELAWS